MKNMLARVFTLVEETEILQAPSTQEEMADVQFETQVVDEYELGYGARQADCK